MLSPCAASKGGKVVTERGRWHETLIVFSTTQHILHSTLHNTIDGVIHWIGLLWFGVCVVICYCDNQCYFPSFSDVTII
jgi:hypothetical protein